MVQDCFCKFLLDNIDPESREFADVNDQIREVLIHANYFSPMDVTACLEFDIAPLSNHGNFSEMEELFAAFWVSYAEEDK